MLLYTNPTIGIPCGRGPGPSSGRGPGSSGMGQQAAGWGVISTEISGSGAWTAKHCERTVVAAGTTLMATWKQSTVDPH